nr:MAG TPA: major capsid protein [Caudoviricetes sp.]
MLLDKENIFYNKQAITSNTSSPAVYNGGGDAYKAPWLVIRIDKDVTGTPLFNVYTSNKENMESAVLLHGITLPANAKAGTEVVTRLGQGVKQYIKVNANNMTGGTISSFLVFDVNMI